VTAPTATYAHAHAGAGPTERSARDRVAPKAGQLRSRVLALVVISGDRGLTATEAYEAYVDRFGEPTGGLYSIAPRLSELERRGAWIEKSGLVRNRRAVYVATDAGSDWFGLGPF
jgi:hypothetical protein